MILSIKSRLKAFFVRKIQVGMKKIDYLLSIFLEYLLPLDK